MTSVEGVRLSPPPNTPRVQRAIPAPYARPSVTIGGGAAQHRRRRWRQVLACDLRVDDTVAHLGLVHTVTEHFSGFSVRAWTITVHAGDGNTRTLSATELVMAFVEEPDLPAVETG